MSNNSNTSHSKKIKELELSGLDFSSNVSQQPAQQNHQKGLDLSQLQLSENPNLVGDLLHHTKFSHSTSSCATPYKGMKTFGRYQVMEILGKGGMGEVYKAYDPQLDRVVALKIIITGAEESGKQRFLIEAKANARLQNANIAKIFDIGEQHGQLFFTMEYIEGKPLVDIIKDQSLTHRQIIKITCKLAHALGYAHEQGIVHRDLKPANIIIKPDGEPCIIDFGLAKLLSVKGSNLTQSDAIIGTPYYMSPEQAGGITEEVDFRSDIYSLGVVLYEMLTGRVPFTHENKIALLLAIAQDKPTPPSTVNPKVPKALERVCLTAMAKDKFERFESMEQFLASLSQLGAAGHLRRSVTSRTRNENNNKLYLIFSVLFIVGLMGMVLFVAAGKQNKTSQIDKLFSLIDEGVFSINPEATSCIMYRPKTDSESPFKILQNGEQLSSDYEYYIWVHATQESFCYIVQIDSQGNFYWLSPRNAMFSRLSHRKNPMPANIWHRIPEAKGYMLDETIGMEHIYIIFSSERWIELEKALVTIGKTKKFDLKYMEEKFGLTRQGDRPRGIDMELNVTWPENVAIEDRHYVEPQLSSGKKGILVMKHFFFHVDSKQR